MIKTKKLDLKKEDIIFECSNPKCGCTNFTLDTDHINGYGELGCPMCFSKDIRVIFLNYKKVEKKR